MESRNSRVHDEFICGVVEGFYGRPWTTEQRKDLFQKLSKWGMNSYIYAPKDDYKHRAYWRELYTVEESDHLGGLIASSKENDIRFIYAISPGLDITYSSQKDVTALKRKLEQVNQLGCDSFAILFDDIDPDMSKADKEMFKSFAHAQVSVTNEAFQFINANKFLFCPTQYCATRSVPNVSTSEYLKTIGSKLDLRIDIMWTGPKVISKEVTIESIEEVTEVMRRPPVIWDNLHANDYDQKRLFLGPYSGRSPQLISRLRGVVTNPNCEYGANFVAIHTLAQWSRCCIDAKKKIEESMSADIKLETENENGHVPENLDPNSYHPKAALKIALKEWTEEFKKIKSVWGPMVKPQIVTVPVPLLPSINTCISVTTTTNSTSQRTSVPIIPNIRELNSIVENTPNQLIASGFSPSSYNFLSGKPVLNSLVEENKIVCEGITSSSIIEGSHSKDIINDKALNLEPMDTATPPNETEIERQSDDILMDDSTEKAMSGISTPVETTESSPTTQSVNSEPSVMNLDNESTKTNASANQLTMQVENQCELLETEADDINEEDLQLLCDLFYLPFEHGGQGLVILQEFQWIKANAQIVAGISSADKSKPEVIEWYERANKFEDQSKKLNHLLSKMNLIPNRELLYELYPYVWDMRGVVSLLNSYIKWLALGEIPASLDKTFVQGSYTWFSKGWREAFMSGDQEPWVIRGGLTAELQRLIPVDRGTDLYVYKAPDMPSSQIYTIRPFNAMIDENSVYKICMATFKDGLNAADELMQYSKLPGDLKVGGFIHLKADLGFVVEDESESIVGFAFGALDATSLRKKLNNQWIPILRERYPIPEIDEDDFLKDVISYSHKELTEIDEFSTTHPAELRMIILTSLVDPSVPKRLMTCILAAFRSNGVLGCFVEVPSSDQYFIEFYKKLGFNQINNNFYGRSF